MWDDDVLFPEEIEARANGPVARELHEAHRGKNRISCLRKCRLETLTETQREAGET